MYMNVIYILSFLDSPIPSLSSELFTIQISDMPEAAFKPGKNLSAGFVT